MMIRIYTLKEARNTILKRELIFSNINSRSEDFSPEEIEIFYGLAKEYWGKGLATEAGKAVLHYGFDTIGLDEIVAVTHSANVASIRVIEKLGLIYKKKVQGLPKKYSSYEGCLYYSLSRDKYFKMLTAG